METTVVVGRIGRPHGVMGEVSVEPRTDEPDQRFAPDAVLAVLTPAGTAPHGAGRSTSLTVRSARKHQSRLLVSFAEVNDRDAAEALRGLILATTVDPDETPEDKDEYYDHQLIGLRVVTGTGKPVGHVTQVRHGAAQDLLVVHTDDGRDVMVPFVSQLVPTVDVPRGRIVVDDRPGLLDPVLDSGEGASSETGKDGA
jgi:16S rRNA processing protein RimM